MRRALAPEGDAVSFQGRSVHVASWAKRFLFQPEQLELTVGRLSGGEQARILIARLMLEPADMLVLDEPTNDLDMETLDLLEDVLDQATEGGLVAERITRPRQRRIVRLIEDARAHGRLKPLRGRLLTDAAADINLLETVHRDFGELFEGDPKLALVRDLVRQRVIHGAGQKVLLVSQFADTAFAIYRTLQQDDEVAEHGIGLIMSTSKAGEAPVQMNGRPSTREHVLRSFAPVAWEQSTVDHAGTSHRNDEPGSALAILVGTDTISVGQNLQDCRTLLHLDLTWNPMMLEQRIGSASIAGWRQPTATRRSTMRSCRVISS